MTQLKDTFNSTNKSLFNLIIIKNIITSFACFKNKLQISRHQYFISIINLYKKEILKDFINIYKQDYYILIHQQFNVSKSNQYILSSRASLMAMKNLQFMLETCQSDVVLTNNQIKRGFIWFIQGLEDIHTLLKQKSDNQGKYLLKEEIQIDHKYATKKQFYEFSSGIEESIGRFIKKMDNLNQKIEKQKEITQLQCFQLREELIRQINEQKSENKLISIQNKQRFQVLEGQIWEAERKRETIKEEINKKCEQVKESLQKSIKRVRDDLKRLTDQLNYYANNEQFLQFKAKTQKTVQDLKKKSGMIQSPRKSNQVRELYDIVKKEQQKQAKNQSKYIQVAHPNKTVRIQKQFYDEIASALKISKHSAIRLQIIQST